jgi:hypothetical protein
VLAPPSRAKPLRLDGLGQLDCGPAQGTAEAILPGRRPVNGTGIIAAVCSAGAARATASLRVELHVGAVSDPVCSARL